MSTFSPIVLGSRALAAIVLMTTLVTFSLQPGQAVPIGGLTRVADRLRKSTKVAILLPASFSDALTSSAAYAIVKSASRNAYVVQVASSPRCDGATLCLLATVTGSIRKPSSLGRPVRLPNGTLAYYADSALTWHGGAAWYRLAIPGTSLYSLRMATRSMRSF